MLTHSRTSNGKKKKEAVGRSATMETVEEGSAKYKLKRLSDGPHEISLRTERLSEKGEDPSNASCRDLVLKFFSRYVEFSARNHEDTEAVDFDDRGRPNRRTEHRRMPQARQHILRAEDPVQNR